MSGLFYVWLVLLLLSYPFAYKYYGTLRKQSKKPMAKNKENATFCKQLKNVFKNKNAYGAGFFIASSIGLIDSLQVSEWVNCLALFLWISFNVCLWKWLADKY